jgi:hypothetical protein
MIAVLTADLARAAPSACVVAEMETWLMGPFGTDFDLAFDLLLHGGTIAGPPPVDDGSGFFTGADAALS